MNENSIDLIVTSPPYFNARDYSQYESVSDYMTQMKDVFTKAFKVLKPSRMCIINISPVLVEREKRSKQSYRIPLPFYYVPMMEEIGFEFLEDIIWAKPDGSVPNRNGGFYRHRKPVAYKPNIITEYVLVFKKPAPFLIDKIIKDDSLVTDGYERTNIWYINPETKSWHPAPFPYRLVENCIRYYSYEGDWVYDPFAGSGTVGKVAEKLKRNWILSELNTEYFNNIKKELNDMNEFYEKIENMFKEALDFPVPALLIKENKHTLVLLSEGKNSDHDFNKLAVDLVKNFLLLQKYKLMTCMENDLIMMHNEKEVAFRINVYPSNKEVYNLTIKADSFNTLKSDYVVYVLSYEKQLLFISLEQLKRRYIENFTGTPINGLDEQLSKPSSCISKEHFKIVQL